MALTLYLAMTAAEIRNCAQLPAHMAWMACHFSPYSSGISNVPEQLPEGSVLILNDRIPPQGHDPALVASRLAQAAEQLQAARVLLDFQRPDSEETAKIVEAVVSTLPCPVGVTTIYAQGVCCPVFLSPLLSKPLGEQLALWEGREVWLEATWDCVCAELTEEGCRFCPAPLPGDVSVCHADEKLHCRYFTELEEDRARFILWRDQAQLQALLEEADALGVECAIGLYQQLRGKVAEEA